VIRFLTLYLGLVWGSLPMQFEVSPEVASIEVLVDGQTLGHITKAPWAANLRLGDEIVPHEVVAIALDAAGEPIAEATQWLNFGREFTEARIVFVQGSDRRRVRIDAWSGDGETPNELRLRLDGERLRAGREGVFDLPELDLDELHYLAADVGFPNGAEAHPELVFGGIYGAVETSELTALAVELPADGLRPDAAAMAGWFEVDEPWPDILPWMTEAIDLASTRASAGAVRVLLSDDDPFTRDVVEQQRRFESELGASVRIVPGAGHFNSRGHAEVLEERGT